MHISFFLIHWSTFTTLNECCVKVFSFQFSHWSAEKQQWAEWKCQSLTADGAHGGTAEMTELDTFTLVIIYKMRFCSNNVFVPHYTIHKCCSLSFHVSLLIFKKTMFGGNVKYVSCYCISFIFKYITESPPVNLSHLHCL